MIHAPHLREGRKAMAEEANQAPGDASSAILAQHLYKVLESTMAEALQAVAVQTAVTAVHNCKSKQLKDISEVIKHDMDQKCPAASKSEGVYNCVAGRHFASAISHGTNQYMHLKVDTLHIILWKSK